MLSSKVHIDITQTYDFTSHLGVEVDNLTMVADKYSSVLYSIIDCQRDNDQLYKQLQRNIKKKIDLHLNEIENEPYGFLIDLCCLDHVSELSVPKTNNENDDEQHLHKFLQNKKYLESLFEQPIAYWHELIKKYLLEWPSTKRTVILLKPNSDLLIEQQGNVLYFFRLRYACRSCTFVLQNKMNNEYRNVSFHSVLMVFND